MSPIPSTSLDSLAGVFASAFTSPPTQLDAQAPAKNPANHGMEWLATWLGQTATLSPVEDGVAALAETPKAALDPDPTKQSQQWMTLLPSIPAYNTIFATPAFTDPETSTAVLAALPINQFSRAVPLDLPQNPETNIAPEIAFSSPEDSEESNTALGKADPANLAPLPPPTPPLVVTSNPPAPIPSPVASIDNEVEPERLQTASPAPLPEKPAPREMQRAPAQTPQPQLQSQPDKGEIVWSADFVVKDVQKTKVESRPAPLPAAQVEKPIVTGDVPSAKAHADIDIKLETDRPNEGEAPPQKARKQAPGIEGPALPPLPPEAAGDQNPDAERDNNQQHTSGTEPQAPKTTRAKREELPEPRAQTIEQDSPAQTAASGALSPRSSSIPPPPGGEPPKLTTPAIVGSADPEPSKTLRPTQIATLSVDVTAPGSAEGSTPMRLSVTQRGDQVNVRLRSWDASAPPIDSDRMQPLLQSLADQGIMPEGSTSRIRLEDSGPILTEAVKDKPFATAASPGSQNDQQSFQSQDDRQQRNQERQQQAFFMRRQMKNLQSTSFDVRNVLDPNSQQGAR